MLDSNGTLQVSLASGFTLSFVSVRTATVCGIIVGNVGNLLKNSNEFYFIGILNSKQ